MTSSVHDRRSDANSSVLGAVPIIDMSGWWSGEVDARRSIAAQVNRACEEIGFFALTGHGIDPATVEACVSAGREFFRLPTEEKRIASGHRPDALRGYVPMASRTVAYSMDRDAPPDLREIFSIGPVAVDYTDPYFSAPGAVNHFAPNVWPAEPAGFRSALETYYVSLHALAADIMDVFALALDLPPRYFDAFIDRSISMLEILNYPPLTARPLPGQMRVGEHSDYGSLTILWHENAQGGLQVRTLTGEWIDVPAVPDGFVVNIGDLMAQWTGDRWHSTVHRVAVPPWPDSGSGRMSMAFFHQPNYDALITCLTGTGEAGEVRYPPITSGDHLSRKLGKMSGSGAVSAMASAVGDGADV